MEDTVHATLLSGPHGRPVTDYRVTLARSGFAAPLSTVADFHGLTPGRAADARWSGRTRVYEPYHAFEVELPLDAPAPVTARLAAHGAQFGDDRRPDPPARHRRAAGPACVGGRAAAAGAHARGRGLVVPPFGGPPRVVRRTRYAGRTRRSFGVRRSVVAGAATVDALPPALPVSDVNPPTGRPRR